MKVTSLFTLCLVLASPAMGKAKVFHLGIASNFSKVSSSSSNPYGNYFRNGIKLALLHNVSKLKRANVEVKLVEFDYADSKLKVLDAARQACKSDVSAVLGYVYSSHALLAAPIHQKCKLPLLTSSATADRLGKMGSFVHQGTFNNTFQGQVLATYALKDLKARSAATIAIANCAYCQDLSRSFAQKFKSLGGAVKGQYPVLETQSLTKMIDDIKRNPVDVILVPNHEIDSANIVLKLAKAGLNVPFLGGDGWGDTGKIFFNVLGTHVIKGFSVSHWRKDIDSSKSKNFYQSYLKTYKQEPNDTAVLSYDSMSLLLFKLLQMSDFSRVHVERALSNIKRFKGATGAFVFRPNNSPKKSIVLLEARQNKFKFLKVIDP